MEESLRAMLLADAGVAELVATRVAWLTRPQASELPAIALQVISSIPVDSDEGDSGLVGSRVQIDCWALAPIDAKKTARAVKQLLSGKTLQYTGPTGGTAFQGIATEDERDSVEETTGAVPIYRVGLDFLIWHNQT